MVQTPSTENIARKGICRRIVALTGATQIGGGYALDVGTTRFKVRECRICPDGCKTVTNSKCGYEETCFYPAHEEMPKAEQIATALLHLKSNPTLFDGWAARNYVAFKADGQGVHPCAVIGTQ